MVIFKVLDVQIRNENILNTLESALEWKFNQKTTTTN